MCEITELNTGRVWRIGYWQMIEFLDRFIEETKSVGLGRFYAITSTTANEPKVFAVELLGVTSHE